MLLASEIITTRMYSFEFQFFSWNLRDNTVHSIGSNILPGLGFIFLEKAIEHFQPSLALQLITKGEEWVFPMFFFLSIICSDISKIRSSDPASFYGNLILPFVAGNTVQFLKIR